MDLGDLVSSGGPIFTGVTKASLDAKNRFTVPSRWRDSLNPNKTLYVMPGIGEGEHCLWIYPQQELQFKIAKLRQASMADTGAKVLARIFAGGTVECEWDTQGRLRLTDFLLEHARLEKEALIVGTFSRFELWEPNLYKQYREENQDLAVEQLGKYL